MKVIQVQQGRRGYVPDSDKLIALVRELLGKPRARVTLDSRGFGTWSSSSVTGTWTDDGEVFLDD